MLLAGGLCAGLVLAEGICRLTVSNPITGPPDPDRTSWRVEGLVNDPLVGFSFQPGFSGRMSLPGDYDVPFRISPQGLRDDRIFGPTHEGITRILLVGD
ncbi:MAG TPA: hypothetical protein VK824_10315, partial [Planctomycetota bacterium]|nr:hypothetical protein [Planctomycetota bacterium]